MELYRIIQDESELDSFIQNSLPDLGKDECFYVSLFARKKYSPELIWSSDKSQLKRLTCTKETLKQKLRQLEISKGCYVLGNKPAPQESLVVYIHPNPRSQKQAARILLKKMADLIADNNSGFNVQAEALSAIQKSRGRRFYVDFDFDLKDKNEIPLIISNVLSFINKEAVTFVETRGGLHVLIKTKLIKDEYKKTWHSNISALGSDVQGDYMLPIPGCCQGGFIPRILNNVRQIETDSGLNHVLFSKGNEDWEGYIVSKNSDVITIFNFADQLDLLSAQDIQHLKYPGRLVKLAVEYASDLFMMAINSTNLDISELSEKAVQVMHVPIATGQSNNLDYVTLLNNFRNENTK